MTLIKWIIFGILSFLAIAYLILIGVKKSVKPNKIIGSIIVLAYNFLFVFASKPLVLAGFGVNAFSLVIFFGMIHDELRFKEKEKR